ncbi:MAG TPA: HEAT repeat domain-containing protein [Terriglobales bacterium]|nr:HEAT repeat domain-containing protein [Terriglobales bacterium]
MDANPDPRMEPAPPPENDPRVAGNGRPRRWLVVAAAVGGIMAGTLLMGTGSARAAWQEIAQLLSLHGKPEPASANVLSEHEIEVLDQMAPQNQAQLLLERSINHYHGANDQIAQRVDRWRGKIKLDQKLNSLFMTGLNSDDLRVRAAAIEIDLACRNLEKSVATVDRLEHDARYGEQGARANALWDIALLANRGIEPGRAGEILLASVHDQNVNIRYWAVEGLAYLGTDETIAPLLQVFHDDPSPMIRERAACGLAQSGMLSEKQRRSAVPQLLDFAADPSLDPETRKWVFQALRDITGQSLPHDPVAWRNWYDSNDGHWAPVTRDSE